MVEFPTVAVLGAGTMGHGIAQVAAAAGAQVALHDVSAEAIAAGIGRIAANLDGAVARGKLDRASADAIARRIAPAPLLRDAVAAADLVIEAAPEVLELKRELLAKVAALVPPAAVIASNTSSIPLRLLADAVAEPRRLCGMHFFNPVHLQPLLEVVRAAGSDQEVVDRVVAFGRALGKTPIVVQDVAGFASSRLGLALGLEAIRMVEEGVASPAAIDTAMTLGYRHPLGPLALTDLVGLDVRLAIAEVLARELDGARFAPPALLRRMVAEGRLGRKSGEGFYRYGPDGAPLAG